MYAQIMVKVGHPRPGMMAVVGAPKHMLFSRQLPLLAQSGCRACDGRCLLSGVERTFGMDVQLLARSSETDPAAARRAAQAGRDLFERLAFLSRREV
jgi:hypothetical protein